MTADGASRPLPCVQAKFP